MLQDILMKLLFDLIALQPSQGKFHGGGEYGKAVLYKLLECVTSGVDLIFCYDPDSWIDPQILEDIKERNFSLFEIRKKGEVVRLIGEHQVELFYSAMPYEYGNLKLENTLFVMTVHGLRDIEMPFDLCEPKYMNSPVAFLKYCIRRFAPGFYQRIVRRRFTELFANPHKKILVPSLHTKYSLVSAFGLDASDLGVFYSPAKVSEAPVIDGKDIHLAKVIQDIPPYLLVIGSNRWIKNSYRALSAIKKYVKNDEAVVIIGGGKIEGIFKDRKNFYFFDYVENSTLEYLYKSCRMLIYPTLNEGFGYPPMEVLKYGKPVIASAIASLTEVYGESLVYVNPFSELEIANRINMMLGDGTICEEYRKKGINKCSEVAARQKKDLDLIVKTLLEYTVNK